MRTTAKLLALPLLFCQAFLLQAEDSNPQPRALTEREGIPSAFVNGSVNVITGSYNETVVDLVIPGVRPLVVSRSFCSGAINQAGTHRIGPGWTLNHGQSFDLGPIKVNSLPEAPGKELMSACVSERSGAHVLYTGPRYSHQRAGMSLDPTLYTADGLSNYAGGDISGQSNLKNTRVEFEADKTAIVTSGDGTRRFYSSKIREGRSWFADREEMPDGFLHIYRPTSIALSYPVGHIELQDPLGKPVSSVQISYGDRGQLLASDGRWVFGAMYSNKPLRSFVNWQGRAVWYEYGHSSGNSASMGKIVEKNELYGTRTRVRYWKSGWNAFGDQGIYVNHKTPYLSGKVREQTAQVGCDDKDVVTYQYRYHVKQFRSTQNRQFEGWTQVLDPLRNRKDYHWDRFQRLTAIDSYDSDGKLVGRESLVWAELDSPDCSNLKVHRFLHADGRGIKARTYRYDERGNVLEETLWGNLSGHSEIPLSFDDRGYPIDNGCERISIFRQYSDDGLNLLLKEILPSGEVHEFSYVPGTNLVYSKLTSDGQHIHKREFYHYAPCGAVAREIHDDGCSRDEDDLSGVHCRKIKVVQARTEAPAYGLPASEEERYLDLASGEERLLKRTVYEYSSYGEIDSRTLYDADGQELYQIVTHHDETGEVDYTIDALGRTTCFTYDPNGYLLSEEPDYLDYSIHHSYDHAHRKIRTEKRYHDGRVRSVGYRYDAKSQKTAEIDAFGNETLLSYDAEGRMTEKVYPLTSELRASEYWVYNAAGFLVEQVDANGNRTKRSYNVNGLVASVQHPDGSRESYRYALGGNLIESVNCDGLKTVYSYDPQNRLIQSDEYDLEGTLIARNCKVYQGSLLKVVVDAEGKPTYYDYDGAGRRIAERHPRSDGEDRSIFTEYNAQGKPWKITEPCGRQTKVSIKEYDRLGRVIEERVEDQQGTLLAWKAFAHDALGKVCETMERDPHGAIFSTFLIHDSDGRLIRRIDPEGNSTVYTYDEEYLNELGQWVLQQTATDPLGRQEKSTHDARGRIAVKEIVGPYGQLLAQSFFSYDGKGQRTEMRNAVLGAKNELLRWSTVRWEYNSMSQVCRVLEGVGTPDLRETQTFYDECGRKAQHLKADGTVIYYSHDSKGRLIQIRSSDSSVDITYTYDRCGRMLRTEDKANACKVTRAYNSCGMMIAERISDTGTSRYQYDTLGRPTQLTLPDGSKISYSYNPLHMEQVTRYDSKGKRLYQHRYTDYDLSGRNLGSDLAADLGQLRIDRDRLGRVLRIDTKFWREEIPAEDGYDALGLLRKMIIEDDVGRVDSHFDYDERYQLSSETGEFSHDYQTDSLHNRLVHDGASCEHNGLNQLTADGQFSYTYDANGNTTHIYQAKRLIAEYRYDALDRLKEVHLPGAKSLTFLYDPMHRRLSKQTSGEKPSHYWYHGQNEIGAVQDGKVKELRILGNGLGAEIGAAVALELNGRPMVPIHDHRGNVCGLLDMDWHCLRESYRYGAFGEEKIQAKYWGYAGNPWRFSSKRSDEETGLVYFGRRYYNPNTGRWISSDPAGYQDGPNLYAYVKNQPLTHWDEYGLATRNHSKNRDYSFSAFIKAVFGYRGGKDDKESSRGEAAKTEGFRKERFVSTHVGSNPKAQHVRLVYWAGIGNSEIGMVSNGRAISRLYGGEPVEVHGFVSQGIPKDVVHAGLEKLGIYNRAVKECHGELKQLAHWAQQGPSRLVVNIAHSRGASYFKQAGALLSRQERNHLGVYTFGGAAMVPNNVGYAFATNYVSHGDRVSTVVGQSRAFSAMPNYEVKFVGKSPMPEHSILSPTYQRALKLHADQFKEVYGE